MATSSMTVAPSLSAPLTKTATESIGKYAERMALRMAIVVGAALGLLILIVNWDRNPVPMLQDRQGFGVILLFLTPPMVVVTAAIGYMLGVKAHNARTESEYHRHWALGLLPVGLAYGAVVALLIVVILDLLNAAFQDLELALFSGTAVAVLVAGALTQWSVKQALVASSAKLLELAIIIIAGGIYLTATQVDNPEWWRISFSFLGSLRSNANLIFNITLVFGGILIATWMPYFFSDLRVLIRGEVALPRALTWLRVGMWWLAIGIALVGIFKTQDGVFSSIVHNLAAYSLAGVFGLLMLGLRWLIPGASREIKTLTWILLAALAATLVGAGIGYFNTVGLEVIAFSLGIMWLQSLTRATASTASELEPAGYPR
ncbi:MAG: hypothetical protein ACRC1H_07565 [Caldilineaceae bacterium]